MSYYRAAAAWWADKLKNLIPEDYTTNDDNVLSYTMTVATAVLANQMKPSEDTLKVFENLLAAKIKEEISKGKALDLNAGPPFHKEDLVLQTVARQAGITKYILPLKTVMKISKDGVVRVKDFGVIKTIYPVDK